MKNKVEQIMEDYRKGIRKIDEQYEVKEVKKISTKELDEKIEYEKTFIEKLETQGRDENVEIINRAKKRLEDALKEKEQKEEAYENENNKREEKLNNVTKLKNSKVILPSGREVTQAEKDEMDKNDLKDKAVRELTQESNKISEELIKKNKELEAKREEWNNFKYEFEKDENGNSTGKSINDAVIIKIHKEYDDIKKEMIELNKMQENCNKYLEEFRQKDNGRIKKINEIVNKGSPIDNKKQSEEEKTTDDKLKIDNKAQGEEEKTTDDKSKIDNKSQGKEETEKNTDESKKETNNAELPNLDDLESKIINATDEEERESGKKDNKESTTPASKTKKPEIIISRKPTIGRHNHNIQIGTIRKIMRQKPEEIMSKLQGVLPDKKPEYLEKMSQKIDPILLEGIVQLKEKNMLTDREIRETIEKFDNENVIAEEMNFKVTYDMKDLSKGAFLPWNRRDRDMIAQLAEDNKKHGIAEFKDGEEYEPNPIKRMLKRVHTRKLGDGKDEVSQTKHVNTFKKKVKDDAEKSEYDQIIDDMSNAKSVEDLEKIFNEAKKAVNDKKISTTELAGIMNSIKTQKGRLQDAGTAEIEEKGNEEATK